MPDVSERDNQIISVAREYPQLFPFAFDALVQKSLQPMKPPELRDSSGAQIAIFKADASNQDASAAAGANLGLVERPCDYKTLQALPVLSTHHSTCLRTKTSCTVGMGFKDERVLDRYDPLTEHSFLSMLSDVAEDFYELGQGYIEVVKNRKGAVGGLYHVPTGDLWVYLEDDRGRDYHYVYQPIGVMGVSSQRFARWGDRERVARKYGLPVESVSEIITFHYPSNKARWYGLPDWLSACARIELGTGIVQFQSDFFEQRGVPEFMLFVLGGKLDNRDWKTVEEKLRQTTGRGKSHRSLAFNFGKEGLQVQVERMAMETIADPIQFSKTEETLALEIVTAHRTPPLLAGIQITGKMGAANELPNALMGFQALVIGPNQLLFERTLKRTLGGDFNYELEKITDQMHLGDWQTMSRMRQPVTEAVSEGRTAADGLVQ